VDPKPKQFRLLVCGGRDYNNAKQFRDVMKEYYKLYGMEVFICEGGASGADLMAKDLADRVGWDRVQFPANWKKYGKSAGPIRNLKMFNEFMPHECVAFPGGNGTKDMVRVCKTAGCKVNEVKEDKK
jgi:hypothetical protein